MIIHAPISVGELYDKITILELKLEYIFDTEKRKHIHSEYELLDRIRTESGLPGNHELVTQLKDINRELWHIEDFKRACEKNTTFDANFIRAARDVYLKNDKRASIKLAINREFDSKVVEQKSY
jgi:hypothetical protein